MFENPRRGRQARNFTTNVPKIVDLKTSSEQYFPKIDVGCPCQLGYMYNKKHFLWNVLISNIGFVCLVFCCL